MRVVRVVRVSNRLEGGEELVVILGIFGQKRLFCLGAGEDVPSLDLLVPNDNDDDDDDDDDDDN